MSNGGGSRGIVSVSSQLVLNEQLGRNAILAVEPKHFHYIDALRGIAILGVIAVHVSQEVAVFPGIAIASAGAYGVQLFFLVSAVTLFNSYANRQGRELHPTLNFFIRRLFRIVPLFWMAAVCYLMFQEMWPAHAQYWAPQGISVRMILETLTFSHIWSPRTIEEVVPGGWSIGVEMWFYLLVPFLFYYVKTVGKAALITGVSMFVGSVLSWRVSVWLGPGDTSSDQHLSRMFGYFWLPAQIGVFLLGITVYFLIPYARWRFSKRTARCGIILLIPLFFVNAYTAFPYVPVHLSYALLFAVLILCLVVNPTPLLINSLTCRFGDVSYSCYIAHFAILCTAQNHFDLQNVISGKERLAVTANFLVVYLAILFVTYPIAYVLNRVIERPWISFGRWLVDRLESSASSSAAAHV